MRYARAVSAPTERDRGWQWAAAALLLLLFVYTRAQLLSLPTSDLGRHIVNGQVVLRQHEVAQTNLFSYTFPQFPFVNHHWLSGVVFALVYEFTGFVGLSLLQVLVGLCTLLPLLWIARREAGTPLALLLTMVALPLVASRSEVRPEHASYLCATAQLLLLWQHRQGRCAPRWLACIPLIQVLWVNAHVYFFLGFVLVAAFLIEEAARAGWGPAGARSTHRPRAAALGVTGIAAVVASLLNPAGLRGLVQPFVILQDYGYQVVENRPLLTLMRRPEFPFTESFVLSAALLVAGAGWALRRAWTRREWPPIALLLLALFVLAAPLFAARNLALFGYFSIPVGAVLLAPLRGSLGRALSGARLPLALAGLALAGYAAQPGYWRHQHGLTGLGLRAGALRSLEFFNGQGLRGPIFNNFDVGGFLIFGLYPKERVFVDNRPEAYPASFLREVLLPMQTDEEIWRREQARTGFNTIVYARDFAPPGAETFLGRRARDPEWAVVFVDEFVAILVRRTAQNAPIVERWELGRTSP